MSCFGMWFFHQYFARDTEGKGTGGEGIREKGEIVGGIDNTQKID